MRRVELRYRPQLKLPPIPGLPVPYSTIAKYRTTCKPRSRVPLHTYNAAHQRTHYLMAGNSRINSDVKESIISIWTCQTILLSL
ncbi:hypothetical protein AGABI1DRAFT_114227 [Agaricus bisporus var. burnettii JB137-S8]|uniref:Uncharacterized protein n=1 Tax=Agaricus bisporus var. burnettii (strain JB137-S8 / ATCC MYA-4627 / FGSC 10392) TaxID=597362 RepID=K5X6P3_AGABU|nr:uncharacterized protein AGABI1DRAFT_114227 [Agaricus bisporus var. burnettii JB137-S8]EKM78607.1 hypothetical protein AGABI1DRAFT_114227 [Agaricus bisporus var. burnettii JB137-S8]